MRLPKWFCRLFESQFVHRFYENLYSGGVYLGAVRLSRCPNCGELAPNNEMLSQFKNRAADRSGEPIGYSGSLDGIDNAELELFVEAAVNALQVADGYFSRMPDEQRIESEAGWPYTGKEIRGQLMKHFEAYRAVTLRRRRRPRTYRISLIEGKK